MRGIRLHNAHVENTEDTPASGARRLAAHPALRLGLVLSAGKPARHAVDTPHGPTVALLTVTFTALAAAQLLQLTV